MPHNPPPYLRTLGVRARAPAGSSHHIAGRRVAELPPISSTSGDFRQEWDGRDSDGQLVPPGTYIYELLLDIQKDQDKTGLVLVAY